MAVTFAVRQGLAHSVMQSWDRAASVPSAPPRPVAAAPPALPLQPPLVYLSRLVPLALQDHLGLLAYRSLAALPPH